MQFCELQSGLNQLFAFADRAENMHHKIRFLHLIMKSVEEFIDDVVFFHGRELGREDLRTINHIKEEAYYAASMLETIGRRKHKK